MRFLLIHGNNSLSHLFKCLAIEQKLSDNGHDVLIATGQKHESLLSRAEGLRYAVLPDIQEVDGAALPTVEWFRKEDRLVKCIQSEIELVKQYRPDRVLGVFRFTAKASCAAAGMSYDSLTCGCMLPECKEVLGFADDGPESIVQAGNLAGFYRYAAAKLSTAMRFFHLDPIDDIRLALKGKKTFLWDFPAFLPLNPSPGVVHVGPIEWDAWSSCEGINQASLGGKSLAIVSFGTCVGNSAVAERIVRLLLELNYFVLFASGGQRGLMSRICQGDIISRTVPLQRIMPSASIIVTHGGQMTVFEALRHKVPTLVIPFQPEQDHTGVCLERMGCGARLVGSQPFRGNSRVYVDAFMRLTDDYIKKVVEQTRTSAAIKQALEKARARILQYKGAQTLTEHLEASL